METHVKRPKVNRFDGSKIYYTVVEKSGQIIVRFHPLRVLLTAVFWIVTAVLTLYTVQAIGSSYDLTILRQQFPGLGSFCVTVLLTIAWGSLFEWFFHRYFMHSEKIVPWFYQKHDLGHHGITPVLLRALADGKPVVFEILNKQYAITRPEQLEFSTFTPFALPLFYGFHLLFLVPLQLLFPQAPLLVAPLLGITLYYLGYELVHAMNHFPREWWEWQFERPTCGHLFVVMYQHHHFHHINRFKNMNVFIPLADIVFGTVVYVGSERAKIFLIAEEDKPWPRPIIDWQKYWRPDWWMVWRVAHAGVLFPLLLVRLLPAAFDLLILRKVAT